MQPDGERNLNTGGMLGSRGRPRGLSVHFLTFLESPRVPPPQAWKGGLAAETGEARKGEGPEQKPDSYRQSGDGACDLQALASVSLL